MSDAEVDPVAQGARVLERLVEQPGGPELLEVAAARGDIELVGGAVRDLLLERVPRELDVVVAEDAPGLAHALAARLGGTVEVQLHERFGTALVLAIWCASTWPRAAPSPTPRRAPSRRCARALARRICLRRDFTVNAIALALGAGNDGSGAARHAPADLHDKRAGLRAAPHALEDLREHRLRVLHERSFLDDPTRLLRLVRYRVRLGFAVEPSTAALAREAVSAGALATLSGARVGAELRLALSEPQAAAILEAMGELGLLAAIQPRIRFEPALAQRALELLPAGGRRPTLLLAVLLLALVVRADEDPQAEARALLDRLEFPQAEARALLDRLEFPQAERDLALATAGAAPRLIDELPRCTRPSELYALASSVPLEAVALAGALHGNAAPLAQRWLAETRHVRLSITGDDLLAAGVPEGPEIGRRLRATLALRLNGELPDGREAELSAALALP